MTEGRSVRRSARLAMVLAILAVTLLGRGGLAGVDAEVSGTSYTSPHFGYTVTWSLPWYVTEVTVDEQGFDILGLADSQSFVYISGGRTGNGSAAEVVDQYAGQMAADSGAVEFLPLNDPVCAMATDGVTGAGACYRFTVGMADGQTQTFGVLLRVWNLGGGVFVLLEAYTDESLLGSYLAHWGAFGVYAEGEPVPVAATTGCASETHHGIAYCFDPELTARDRADIVEGVRLGQRVIELYFGDPAMDDTQITGLQHVSPFGDGLLATTRDRAIAIYAGSEVWRLTAPIERIETLVHEFFHIYQNVMTAERDVAVPLWFTEGSAEAVGYLATSQIGVTDQAEFYASSAYSLTAAPFVGTLADLDAVGSMDASAYPLAYIAVQYLLGSRGLSVSSIGEVYRALQAGSTFADAFTTVFGVSPDAFVAEFEAWRPNFQQVAEAPDDFWPITGFAQPSAVTLQQVPAAVAPDEQMIVIGATAPLAGCTATVQFGAETIERETYANGEGLVFWLVTVPADAVAGPGTVTAGCGGTLAAGSFVVTP